MAQTANLGLPLIDANMTADVPRDMNALAEAVDTAVTEAVEGVTVPDATTTQKGVVQLNDTTTSTNKTQAGTADAVRRAYERGSEGVTAAAAAQAKADAAETPAGAQAKANTAETNAKNYVDGKQWQKRKLTEDSGLSINISNGDANNLTAAGLYVGENIANAPVTAAGEWYYINVIAMAQGVWVKQVAISLFNNTYQMRTGSDAGGGVISWGPWTQDLFTSVANGKQAIATAISDKGVAASGSDEFAVLANKISQINTGKRFAIGQFVINESGVGSVNNIAFRPRNIIFSNITQTASNRYAGAYSADAPSDTGPLSQVFGIANGHSSPNAFTITNNGFSVITSITVSRTYNYIAFE